MSSFLKEELMSASPNHSALGGVPVPGLMHPQRKSWLARNWFWLLIALAVCGAVLIFGFFSLILGAIRGSDVAKEAVARAQSNAVVVQHVGTPISEGWLVL